MITIENYQTTKLKPSAVKLLRKVEATIKADPRRLDMSNWAIVEDKTQENYNGPKCGTTACIAGWITLLGHKSIHKEMRDYVKRHKGAHADVFDFTNPFTNPKSEASELLGIESDIADRLFFTGSWPEEYRERYSDARTPAARKQVTIHRIEHFIKTRE